MLSRQARFIPRHGVALVGVSVVLCVGLISERANHAGDPAAPSKLKAGDIHLEQSRIFIHVGKTGLGHEHGVRGALQSGRLLFEGAKPAGRLVFDMESFVADVPEARKYLGLKGEVSANQQQQITDTMLSDDVLDAKRHPTAECVIDTLRELPDSTGKGVLYRLEGSLTLHGVKQSIAFDARAHDRGENIHLVGSFKLLQSDFGIKPYSKLGGAFGVTDQLTVWGDLWIVKDRMAE